MKVAVFSARIHRWLSPPLLVSLLALSIQNIYAAGSHIAFQDPVSFGNQAAAQTALGMDFDVIYRIKVTALGAFNNSPEPPKDRLNTPPEPATGLEDTIRVQIWDRDSKTVVATQDITGSQGTLIFGDRFVQLRDPVTLRAGFKGTIVASGFGVNHNGNGHISD